MNTPTPQQIPNQQAQQPTPTPSLDPNSYNAGRLRGQYQQYLGRDIDDEGYQYWSSQIASGKASLNDVHYAIINSDEYKNRSPTPSSIQQGETATPNGSTATWSPPSPAQANHAQTVAAQAGAAQATWQPPTKASSFEAKTTGVGSQSTVQGQLLGLISSGSKYLEQARKNAAQSANARGMLNSAFAAGAGERAAIQAALPIAQQDAATFNQRDIANMDAMNAAAQFNAAQAQQNAQFNASQRQQNSQFNASNKQQTNLFNASNVQQTNQFNASNALANSQFNASQANSMAQAQWSQLAQQRHDAAMKSLDDSGRAQLIAIEAQARRLIEADTNYSRVFESAMNSLGSVLGNTSLSADQQRAAQATILGQVSAFQDFYNRLQGTTIR